MQTQQRDAPKLSPLEDRWLPPVAAAKYLGVEVSTLSKWRLHDKGPRYSVGLDRDPRYQLSELLGFMASKMASGTGEARAVRRAHQAARTHFTVRRPKRPVRSGS